MSGPKASFFAEAMGDPAPARSLDDIDLSALRVSAPSPASPWFLSPPQGSGVAASFTCSPGALSASPVPFGDPCPFSGRPPLPGNCPVLPFSLHFLQILGAS